MANIEHKDLGYAEQHVIHFKEYADSTAREEASGLTEDDNGKVALQTDEGSYWRLTDYSGPTWVNIAIPEDGVITAAKLASNAVETAKIKDANVTAAKLAANAVETAKIKDANVTAAKLEASAKFASGTVMLFGQSSAPTGWTRKADWQDNAMLCYASSGNIGSGGAVNPQSTHTHTGPSHTHTGPSHTHDVTIPQAGWVDGYGHPGLYIGNANNMATRVLAGAAGAAGTGATGAEGTGATGANSAPHYQEVIAATKD